MRLLIVEDDAMLADGLARSLRHAGYAVDCVESAERALLAVEHETFDLVILDVGLPGVDGFEWPRSLRRAERYLPVIVVTAHDAVADRVRGLDLGADDYLVKPFAFEELEAAPVEGEPQLLGELAANLLDNALNYTPPGGEVALRTGRRDGRSFPRGGGQRSRHPGVRAGAGVRAVPSRARHPGARHRARARHRPRDRGPPSRQRRYPNARIGHRDGGHRLVPGAGRQAVAGRGAGGRTDRDERPAGGPVGDAE